MLTLFHVLNNHTTVHFLLLYFHCPDLLLALPLPEGRAECSREISEHQNFFPPVMFVNVVSHSTLILILVLLLPLLVLLASNSTP